MSFREVKPEELTMNPFTKIGKEWLLITAGNEEKCNTMTASWGAFFLVSCCDQQETRKNATQ